MTGRMTMSVVLCATLSLVLLASCDDNPTDDAGVGEGGVDGGGGPPPPPVIGVVPESSRYMVPNLSAPTYVVYTENHVPHVYGENELDVVRVQGFVTARDRFFVMDLGRRLMQGRLAELIGDAALGTDIESRTNGFTEMVDRTVERLTERQVEVLTAYAEGVNFYIAQVGARRAPLPSELMIAGPVLGAPRPMTLLEEFTVRDLAAWSVTILANSSFETKDIGRDQGAAQVETHFEGEALSALRTAGLRDAFTRVTNVGGFASAAGWGLEVGSRTTFLPERGASDSAPFRPTRPLPESMSRRIEAYVARMEQRLGHDSVGGYGSNAWALGGAHTSDGAALVAGDPHLDGTSPTIFYRMHRDTRLLGDGEIHEIGLFVPGVVNVGLGTNGDVAWGGTQLFGDVMDWFREEIVLDSSGVPMETVFAGGNRAIQRIDEEYTVADIPGLDSVGRTETVTRFETFDGRPITMIEGRDASEDEVLAPGESLINVLGDLIVPGDTDGDGVITALSFDWAALEGPNLGLNQAAWSRATSVMDIYNNQDALLANSFNWIAGDSSGSVLNSGFQITPCRAYLPREADGTWSPGADPTLLIDGTRFGGFEIPLTPEGRIDETAGTTDPQRCVVPHDEWPAIIDPPEGYVVIANNDIGNLTADNSLANDPWYVGGPWEDDVRAVRIVELLEAAKGSATEQTMAEIQADTRSALGIYFTPLIFEAITAAEAAASGTPAAGSVEERMAAMWTANSANYTAFRDRMMAWSDGGFRTPIGIETFYSTPGPQDPADSVATTLFNAWLGPFETMAVGDERFPRGTSLPTGDTGRMRVMTRMIDGRGAGNPLGLPSYNDATEESAFFDVRGTPEIETSLEITLRAIDEALTYLASETTSPGVGGFGSDDWDTYFWGLRHHTRFDSLLTDFLGDDPTFGVLVDMFSIDPARLPIMPGIDTSDPRFGLRGFPRPGDNGAIDWGQAGFNGQEFEVGFVAIARHVHSVRGETTTGLNMMQGGQSAISDSEYFDDQTRLWLANEATPTRFTPESVVEGAIERETFLPMP